MSVHSIALLLLLHVLNPCSAIHPGMAVASEKAAVGAQRAVLQEAGLPAEEVEERVVLAATVHTLVGCGLWVRVGYVGQLGAGSHRAHAGGLWAVG